jgi:hypothetical protein
MKVKMEVEWLVKEEMEEEMEEVMHKVTSTHGFHDFHSMMRIKIEVIKNNNDQLYIRIKHFSKDIYDKNKRINLEPICECEIYTCPIITICMNKF